jgi:Predicted esterase of the alpha-beta hydrolase superfamily
LSFIIVVIISLSLFAQRVQKVGLVLSGGGARGLAHVGALQAFEEAQIPIDYVCGTSVGAIVAALYASGYTVSEMKTLFLSQDFQRWLSGNIDDSYSYSYKKKPSDASFVSIGFDTKDKFRFQMPSSYINPIQMDYAFMEIFAPATAVAKNNFDSLFVPFLCVTSDITQNKASIRRNGDLGQAARASMSFPFYFAPISLDGHIMFDGGMYNNFPSKEMNEIFNPDIIIGIQIAGNYPAPKAGDVMSYLQNIFTNETDYNVICDNSVLIEPDLEGIGVLDFTKMEETYDVGYKAAKEKIAKIREFLVDSVSNEELAKKRKAFNDRKPPLKIDNFVINGVSENQKQYLQRELQRDRHLPSINDNIKSNYLSLCSDYNIKTIQPYIYYNNFYHSYVLNLDVKTQENLTAKAGGCISSHPISHLYLGIDYNMIRKNAWLFQTNLYAGRYYTSAMLKIRTNFSSHIPFFSEVEWNANKWNYYRLNTNFFDYSPLNYLVQRENNVQLHIGMPLGIKDQVIANVGYGIVKDDYFNTRNNTIYDTADNTEFYNLATGITRIYSSLDDAQFPTSGRYSKMQVQYIYGKEIFSPGSTSAQTEKNTNYHSWFQFSLQHKQYFDITSHYALGFSANAFYSFQNLFSNYNSSLLNSGVYAPTLETQTEFMKEYHSNQFLAFGAENIFKTSILRIEASLRLNAYIYAPIQRITTMENDIPKYSKVFDKQYFILSSAFVINTPIGPLSLIASYHKRDQKADSPLSFSINFGYVMFNKKNIDR